MAADSGPLIDAAYISMPALIPPRRMLTSIRAISGCIAADLCYCALLTTSPPIVGNLSGTSGR